MTDGHKLDSAEGALAFLLAGKATVTLKSEVTGDHLTFQVRKWKKAQHGSLHFVSVRTGNDFANVGVIRDGSSFSRGKKADVDFDDKRVKAFRYAFAHLCDAKQLPPKCEVWHEGQCGRCGRPLTDPESIARGIGPDCLAKMGG